MVKVVSSWKEKLKRKKLLIRMKGLRLYIYIIVAFSLFSCNTVKEFNKSEKNFPSISKNKLRSLVRDSSLHFNSLVIKKVNIRIKAKGKSSSYRGSIRIIKDSAIWISLNAALGIEAVRLLLTKNTVSFFDRYHKKYYRGDYEFFKEKLGIDFNFNVIQALLINDLLYYETLSLEKSYFKFFQGRSEDCYTLISAKGRKLNRKLKKVVRKSNKHKDCSLIFQENFINPVTFKVNKLIIAELLENKWRMNVSYSDYRRKRNQLLAHIIDFSLLSESKNISCKLSYSGVYLKNRINIPFKIPSKYKQIEE
jgi:hypothetical protein